MTEGAICNGIGYAFFSSQEVAGRIGKSMLVPGKPFDKQTFDALGERAFQIAAKAVRAFDQLESKKMLSREQRKKDFDSGVAAAGKIATFEEMKKRLDACDEVVKELAKLAGTD